MGFFARLLGIETSHLNVPRMPPPPSDAQALERYRYMLKTAPPETSENAHQEAFDKLAPDQRREVSAALAREAPPGEAAVIAATPVDDTRSLAQAATRAEIRQPGVLERSLGGSSMGLGSSLLSSFAMGFVGSMVANSFFQAMGGFGGEDDPSHHDDPGSGHDDGGEVADYGGDDGGFDGGGDFEV